MKKILLSIVAIVVWLTSYSQKIEWADFVFSTVNFNYGMGVVTDATGNVYVLGEIQDPITIQSNPFTNQYGSVDLILIKFNAQGNFLLAKVFGGTGSDNALDLAIDDAGNLYAASFIQGTTNMSDTVYNAGVSNQMIQFDTLFNFKRYIARPNDIILDATGTEVYIAYNHFIEKLDTSLSIIWNRTASTAALTFSNLGPQGGNGTIMVDDYGHLAVSGYENGTALSVMLDTVTLKFGPGNDNELFVMSMDTSGAALWGKTLDSSTTTQELYPKVAVDSSGNIYLALYSEQGNPIYFANDTLFNTGVPGYGALLKYDAAGNPQWGIGYYASTIGVDINDILINPQQEVLVCGTSTGQVQFGNYFHPAAAIEVNPYIAKVNSNGVVQWFKSDSNVDFGTSNFQSITMTPAGEYAATGFYPPISPAGYRIGCFTAPPNGRDILTVVISENPEPSASFTYSVSGLIYSFVDQSVGAWAWDWDFGDGNTSTLQNPIHTYSSPGNYAVSLFINDSLCGTSGQATAIDTLAVFTEGNYTIAGVIIFPNPTSDIVTCNILVVKSSLVKFSLLDIAGRKISESTEKILYAGNHFERMDLKNFSPGLYFLSIEIDDKTLHKKILKQ